MMKHLETFLIRSFMKYLETFQHEDGDEDEDESEMRKEDKDAGRELKDERM